MWVLTSILLLSTFILTISNADEIIRIKNGLVRGSKMSNGLYGFRGIPYAKPPINELRFEIPQEPDNWEVIWNATYDRSECIQVNIDTPSLSKGREDCLYLNVYMPQLPKPNVLLPVMVWVYGGAFIFGNSSYSLYAPDDLVKQGVIVVTFNFRLGIFGFLSTNDETAPGNIGLKDQIFALKWVRNNIQAFGGEPNNVTLFGESAGAASVSYLVISPLGKGLFKSAIMQSGTALCLWSLSRLAEEAAYLVGRHFGIITTNSQQLVTRLKSIPANELQEKSMIVMGLLLTPDPLNGLVYAPVIEPPGEGAIITNNTFELLSNGDFNRIPIIIGFNSAEATGFSSLLRFLEEYLLLYDLKPAKLVPLSMNINKIDVFTLNTIGQLIKTYYAGEYGRLSYPDDNFTLYMSDEEFVRPIQKTAKLMSKYTDVYLYKFSYTTDQNSKGAGHGDEIFYIFVSNRNTSTDKEIRKCMLQLWTNFAKYNKPTPSDDICSGNVSWRPMTSIDIDETYYLNIDRNTTPSVNPNRKDMEFWDELFQKYGERPYVTY